MITWKIKKGAAFRRDHPWGFAKDFDIEANRMQAGDFVRIVNDKNEMLAFGYGNPQCALAFRALPLMDHPQLAAMASVGAAGKDFQNWVVEQIIRAWKRRRVQGFEGSYRIVFSEGDGLPGLILDRYSVREEQGSTQVLAAQILTAGFDRIWGDGTSILNAVVEGMFGDLGLDWSQTIVVERKDVNIRKVEGLPVLPPRILHWGGASLGGQENLEILRFAPVQVAGQIGERFLTLTADLFEGQKTGFFLDQSWNMRIVLQILAQRQLSQLRVLDLCSYVGHWSLQLGAWAAAGGIAFQADLVDVSQEALKRAQSNLKNSGLESTPYHLDVLEGQEKWPPGPYDIVIADPPAFVKAKKDLPQGLHAYFKLNTEAIKRLKSGGILVSCSCSGAVSEEDLQQAVGKALGRAGRSGQILARGQQGWDHPWLVNFPEGRYLKALITQVY